MERLTRCSACNLWQGSAPPNQHYLQGLQPPTSRCPGAEVDPRSKNLEILWMVKNGEKTSCITKRMVKKLYQKLGMFATYQLFHQMLVPFFWWKRLRPRASNRFTMGYYGLLSKIHHEVWPILMDTIGYLCFLLNPNFNHGGYPKSGKVLDEMIKIHCNCGSQFGYFQTDPCNKETT